MADDVAARVLDHQDYAAGRVAGALDRGTLFAGLGLVGFANGVSHRVMASLQDDSTRAVLHTFDIGAIAWLAVFMSAWLLARPGAKPASRRDMLVAGAALVAFALPAPPLSWLALTCLGAYAGLTSPVRSAQRRGAWILLALTVPMFWSRAAFSLFSDGILRLDAVLVAWILGTPRIGNSIAFADGWGYFWIAPGCSSLANVSLAVLCWVLVTQTLDRASESRIRYCVAACLAVAAINVARLVLTGMSYASFEVLHGPTGGFVIGWLTFAVTLGICLYGATREGRA
jgi:exosortase/archaeosortase family protein